MDNGLNVVTVPFDSPGLAAFFIVVRVGSRNEVEKGVTGFAHFFEHMMFRGTDKYPREKYDKILKSKVQVQMQIQPMTEQFIT